MASSVLPILHGRPHGQPPLERLSVLLFAFGPAFTILSLSYEALFYACFCLALVSWMKMEASLARAEGKKEDEGMGLKHVRISLFFLAFLHLGFFGCGNVASISSVRAATSHRASTLLTRRYPTVLPRARLSPDDGLCTVPDGALQSLPAL